MKHDNIVTTDFAEISDMKTKRLGRVNILKQTAIFEQATSA